MGIDSLRRTISECRLLMLDTMVFSYHLFDHPRYAPLTAVILEIIESGVVAGVTSTMTVAELLTVPAQAGNWRAMQDYELYLTNFPNLYLMPLDIAVAREAALVRAETGLRMPDAVQIGVARIVEADAIVTNDRRWVRRVTRPALVVLDEFAD